MRAMPQGYAVYALTDPRDESIRYIGISNNVSRRVQEHIRDATSTSPKDRWLQELVTLSLSPGLTILQTAESKFQAREREKYWIGHYGEKAPLLNWNLNTANLDCGTWIDDPDLEALVYEELMDGRQ